MDSNRSQDLAIAHQQFIDYLTNLHRAHATILAYSKDIEQLVSFLKENQKITVDQVEKADLEGFLRKLSTEGYTPKSLSRKINSIKTFYRFLKTQSLINGTNPASEITHPKYDIKPPRVLTKMEYRALRDACRSDIRTYAIVELFLQTGIRIGELANLKVSDVKEKELHIEAQEGHPERMVPLNKAAKTAIDKWMSIRPKTTNEALFVTKTGRPLLVRNIRTTIDRFFKVAGIEGAKVNDLRHTFIAHHLASGTPLTVISKLVGHKRLSTTEKYLELVKDKMVESVRLEEL